MSRNKGYLLLIIVLFAVGAFIRLLNFNNRLIFGPEQGMSFLTSAQNLEKFSLLGETNWIRSTSAGHIPFHGAYYSYFLLPLLLISNFRVLPVTYFFAFFNLLTAFIFFLITKKLFGRFIAALSLFYFLFSDIMIHHSLFAWIVNPSILLGVLTLWFVSRLAKNKSSLLPVLWIGALSGIGFGLQSFYLVFAFFLFLLSLYLSKNKFLSVVVFLLGVVIGSLPTVIFDLRHDFYHVRTFSQFFLDMIMGKSSGESSYYNFLYLYPYLFLLYAFVTKTLYKFSKPLIVLPLAIFLFATLSSPLFSLRQSVGMAPGITLKTLESAAQTISQTSPPEKFNVATLWDFDTRAHTLRYLLTHYYHLKPQPIEEYKNIDVLYVFAPKDYDINKPKVWELQSFLPYKVIGLESPSSAYSLYKLIK